MGGNEILVKPNAMVVQASPVMSLHYVALHCTALQMNYISLPCNEILVKTNAMVVQASHYTVLLYNALQFVALGWLAMKYW